MVVVALFFVSIYNGLVRRRNEKDNAWSQIDVQLKRRHDLIPNIVETVKGYAKHERETLDAVIKARNAAVSAQGPAAAGQAEGVLGAALGKLFALAEAYPDLKANQNYLALQEELTSTENRIGYAARLTTTRPRDTTTLARCSPPIWSVVGLRGPNCLRSRSAPNAKYPKSASTECAGGMQCGCVRQRPPGSEGASSVWEQIESNRRRSAWIVAAMGVLLIGTGVALGYLFTNRPDGALIGGVVAGVDLVGDVDLHELAR